MGCGRTPVSCWFRSFASRSFLGRLVIRLIVNLTVTVVGVCPVDRDVVGWLGWRRGCGHGASGAERGCPACTPYDSCEWALRYRKQITRAKCVARFVNVFGCSLLLMDRNIIVYSSLLILISKIKNKQTCASRTRSPRAPYKIAIVYTSNSDGLK